MMKQRERIISLNIPSSDPQKKEDIFSQTNRQQSSGTSRLSHQNQSLSTPLMTPIRPNNGQILQLESEIRKLKHLMAMQKDLLKNKSEFNLVSTRINDIQQDLKSKIKEAISQKLVHIEKRKKQRESFNKQSDEVLEKVKLQQRKRRERMESIVSMYKQEYQQIYQKNLRKRKDHMKMDFGQIKAHQFQYLKKIRKSSLRANTQPTEQRISSISEHRDPKTEWKRQLMRKGKIYGDKAERIASNIKIPIDLIQKGKNIKQNKCFDESIDKYEEKIKKIKKPRLDTNLNGDIQVLKSKEISRISHQQSPLKERLTTLQNLVGKFKAQYDCGHEQALDQMSRINLTRAKLLLQDI